jgi:hypothetical protein
VPFDDDGDDDMLSMAPERRLTPWRYIRCRLGFGSEGGRASHTHTRDETELYSGHLLVRRSTTSCCRRGGRVRRTKEIGRLPTLAALRNNGRGGTFRGHACFLDLRRSLGWCALRRRRPRPTPGSDANRNRNNPFVMSITCRYRPPAVNLDTKEGRNEEQQQQPPRRNGRRAGVHHVWGSSSRSVASTKPHVGMYGRHRRC